jgi:hypothetical protein
MIADHAESSAQASKRDDHLRLRVLVQCKAERESLGPRSLRELEGTVLHAGRSRRDADVQVNNDAHDATDVIGVLSSQSPFSPKTMLHATGSRTPLLLLHLPGGQPTNIVTDDRDIRAKSLWWNQAVSGHRGLLKGAYELRSEIDAQTLMKRYFLWGSTGELEAAKVSDAS